MKLDFLFTADMKIDVTKVVGVDIMFQLIIIVYNIMNFWSIVRPVASYSIMFVSNNVLGV